VTAPGAGTDVAAGNFIPDADPATTTNPLDARHRRGGVSDGAEDGNHDGAIGRASATRATRPTTPAVIDSDGDGLSRRRGGLPRHRSRRRRHRRRRRDRRRRAQPGLDTDGDGLINALDPDSDDDGVFDGTEVGVTVPDPDTDVGNGHFVADANPVTRTSPLVRDTDHGGVTDGSEDPDRNGRVDAAERNPQNPADDVQAARRRRRRPHRRPGGRARHRPRTTPTATTTA
jgi:hypothetical protein